MVLKNNYKNSNYKKAVSNYYMFRQKKKFHREISNDKNSLCFLCFLSSLISKKCPV